MGSLPATIKRRYLCILQAFWRGHRVFSSQVSASAILWVTPTAGSERLKSISSGRTLHSHVSELPSDELFFSCAENAGCPLNGENMRHCGNKVCLRRIRDSYQITEITLPFVTTARPGSEDPAMAHPSACGSPSAAPPASHLGTGRPAAAR